MSYFVYASYKNSQKKLLVWKICIQWYQSSVIMTWNDLFPTRNGPGILKAPPFVLLLQGKHYRA